MGQVVTFLGYTPPARFDSVAWSEVRIEEAPLAVGPWTQIDVIALVPLDADPSIPQLRSFTTENGTAPDQWYRILFADAGGDTSPPSLPVQNVEPVSYATTAELFRVLKVRTPTAAQTEAAEIDLATATLEINKEIDLGVDAPPLDVAGLALVRGVCIDRAADLWRHRESVPGLMGPLDDVPTTTPGRYSFARYTARLSVLKDQWGIA